MVFGVEQSQLQCSVISVLPHVFILYLLNTPGLGALLGSLALILQAIEALEEGYDQIGLVFSESQELREWLNEVRAWQLVNQLGSQGNLPGRLFPHGVLCVKMYIVLSHCEQNRKNQ